MDFGEAIRLMKAGAKVQREGWNGKSMYIGYMPGYHMIPANKLASEFMDVDEGEPIGVSPYIAMRDAHGNMVPGWLASQTDILAEDWQIFEE